MTPSRLSLSSQVPLGRGNLLAFLPAVSPRGSARPFLVDSRNARGPRGVEKLERPSKEQIQ